MRTVKVGTGGIAHVLFTIANNSSVPYFNWFADRAAEAGFRFTFVALHAERPQMLVEMGARGFGAHWIPFSPAHRRIGMFRALPILFRLILRSRPDIVHTHLFDDSVPGLLAARLARTPVRVITKQDVGFHWRYTPRWVVFDRLNNANATHIHAVSEITRRFIVEKERADPAKLHVIRQGCDVATVTAWSDSTVEDLRASNGFAGRFVVGTVARLVPWKGHRLVLAAIRRLVTVNPNLLFVWAGTGELRRELEKAVALAGLSPFVRFLGWVDRREMPSLYRCFDAYLHPAAGEPFGFAIAEAMLNGVPVAATRCGSTEEASHLRDFYALDEGSTDAIVAAVSYLLADARRREEVAACGHRFALAHLTVERYWEGHRRLYDAALGGRTV